MKIYSKYKDYQEYVDIQTETNKAKIDVVWVSEIEVEYICNYIQSLPLSLAHKSNMYSDEMYNVMCHGARNGTEVTFFEKHLDDNWIVEGNDISETAFNHGLYQWDMQDYNEDWKQKFTIQYTNSFDHVYDPQKTINSFMKQCATGGSVFIQWTENLNNEPLPSDPLSINLEELVDMCSNSESRGRERDVQTVNILDSGMNRVVRKKNTNEEIKRYHIYWVELVGV